MPHGIYNKAPDGVGFSKPDSVRDLLVAFYEGSRGLNSEKT